MLEGADLLDGHSSLAHVVISRAERAREMWPYKGGIQAWRPHPGLGRDGRERGQERALAKS